MGFDDLRDITDLKQLEVLDLTGTAVHELDLLIEFPFLKQLSIIWCHWLKDHSPIHTHPSLSSLGVIPKDEDDIFQKEMENLRIAMPNLDLVDDVDLSMEYWYLNFVTKCKWSILK